MLASDAACCTDVEQSENVRNFVDQGCRTKMSSFGANAFSISTAIMEGDNTEYRI